MKIERIKLAELRHDNQNARTHDQANLRAIAGSLEQFGQRKPIVITQDNKVVAGNGTLTAAKLIGWTEIDCVRVPADWTADQIKAYALADNRTAELAQWDEQVMAAQLIDLQEAGFDIESFGFELVNPPVDLEAIEEDEIPEDAPTRTALGDIWKLGKHRLMCGSTTSFEDMDKLMEKKKADIVFTDPPYGVAYTGGIQFKDGEVQKNNREMIQNDDADIYEAVMQTLGAYANGPCYIWFAGTRASTLYEAAEKYGDIHALIIWVKNGGYGALNANYKQKHEPCLYWKPRGKSLNFTGSTTETTVWQIKKDGRNNLHPTQKPVALAAKAISNHSGDLVFDGFGGSGATLIASEQVGKTCFMMELDPKYCDVIMQRWENLTGKKAELVNASR
jgi:site-specific DNA-methyltransferase (adenine-specific)